ncbi:MAG: copper transporter [Actinomycetota bacterium]
MIDFRYHLVSIVAVFLALGIGILMGSLVLGEALVNQLRRDLDNIDETNNRLRAETVELNRQLDANQQFALATRPYLIGGKLDGEQVVVFAFEGSEGDMLEEIRGSVTDSGGTVATTVTLRDKLAASSAPERNELALVVDSQAESTSELLDATGSILGTSFAAAADSPAGDPSERDALEELVRDLEAGGFIDVDRNEEVPLAPPNAVFVIAAGAEEPSGIEVAELAVPLGRELAADRAGVIAAEPSTSSWGLVASVRNDSDTNASVGTVDQAESISGGIGVVLALDLAENGVVTHSGTDSGAQAVIPLSSPSP